MRPKSVEESIDRLRTGRYAIRQTFPEKYNTRGLRRKRRCQQSLTQNIWSHDKNSDNLLRENKWTVTHPHSSAESSVIVPVDAASEGPGVREGAAGHEARTVRTVRVRY